jgi:hypothetical protein
LWRLSKTEPKAVVDRMITLFLPSTPAFLLSNLGFPSLFDSFFGDFKYTKNHLKLSILFGYIKNPQKRNFNFNLFYPPSFFFLPMSFLKVKVHLNL